MYYKIIEDENKKASENIDFFLSRKSEEEYTNFIKSLTTKSASVCEMLHETKTHYSTNDYLLSMLDLITFDSLGRTMSSYDDYFSPGLIRISLEKAGYQNERLQEAFKILTNLHEQLQQDFINSLVKQALSEVSKNLNNLKQEQIKFTDIKNSIKIVFRYFDNKSIAMPNLDNLIIKDNQGNYTINSSLFSAEENPTNILQKVKSLVNKNLEHYKNITKIGNIFSENERFTFYNNLIANFSESEKEFLAEAICNVLSAQASPEMIHIPGSIANNTYSRLYNHLTTFHEQLIEAMNLNGFEDALIVPLLGDGETFAYYEFLMGNENVNFLYISRLTLLTTEEFIKYREAVVNNQTFKSDASFLNSGNLYSKLYATVKNEFGNIIQQGIYINAINSAKDFFFKFIEYEMEKNNLLIPSKTDQFKAYKRAIESFLANKSELEKLYLKTESQRVFLNSFREEVLKEIQRDRSFAEKTREIYNKQLAPLLAKGKKLVFIDSGLKGTIPALLCALVDIYSPDDFLTPEYEPKANMFLFSIQKDFSAFLLHYTESKDIGKKLEDAAKFGKLDQESLHNPETEGTDIFIVPNDPKNYSLALIDANILRNLIENSPPK